MTNTMISNNTYDNYLDDFNALLDLSYKLKIILINDQKEDL